MNQTRRSGDYRYRVDLLGSEITPLASVEAFLGNLKLRVSNISFGGIALLFDCEPTLAMGDIASISVCIRERHFPTKVEVRGIHGLVLHCSYSDPSKAFLGALREFLRPKFLGQSLERNVPLSNRPDALLLVEDAHNYEAFVGQNETAVFVWTTDDRNLLKIFCASGELVFEWARDTGLRTGRQYVKEGVEEIDWSRMPDSSMIHYFADILLAWLSQDWGANFVDKLFLGEIVEDEALKFPAI